MNIIGIIPARLAATRFPNKPLAMILGIPMIAHCYYRCKMSPILNEVYVATCDKEIFDYINSIGGKAIMTADTHERASDRTAEAVSIVEKLTGKKVDIVAMIQGDEPFTTPKMLETAIQPLIDDNKLNISNLIGCIQTIEEHQDPNEVKVVVDKNFNALYFSREPIPSRKKTKTDFVMYKQLGIIIFRKDFLLQYNSMAQTTLEKIESVDMLRLLENGLRIQMVLTTEVNIGVDTLEDLERAEKLMKVDRFFEKYNK
jgi:3-deoxy-manno-octulosonate cytidylyltransferase (CMP-KDO synthetase)